MTRVQTCALPICYSRRTFIAPETGIFAFVDGARDENYYLNLFVCRRLDEKSGVDANVYANYFDSSVAGTIDVYNMGAYASYNRDFPNRLRGMASLGVDSMDTPGFDSSMSAFAQLVLHYQDRKSTRLNSRH